MTRETEHPAAFRIGVVSDTHGELPDAVTTALRGVDTIVHAGDVGTASILHVLGSMAPVLAVRGNCDTGPEVRLLPPSLSVMLGGVRVAVSHHAGDVEMAILSGGAIPRVAISGHSHVPSIEERDGVLWVNPGSVTSPRAGSRPSVATVIVEKDGRVAARIAPIDSETSC